MEDKAFRVLKNPTHADIKTIFRGRPLVLLGKKSLTLEGDEANEKADFLIQTYGFLQDITQRILKEKVAYSTSVNLSTGPSVSTTVSEKPEKKTTRKRGGVKSIVRNK